MSNQNPFADEIVELNAEILALEHALEIAAADRDAARKANERLTAELERANRCAELSARVEHQLEAERDRLTAELHGVQADYHAVQAERDEWIEHWRKAGVLYSQLQAGLHSATADAANVGREAERLRAERDVLVAIPVRFLAVVHGSKGGALPPPRAGGPFTALVASVSGAFAPARRSLVTCQARRTSMACALANGISNS